MTYYFLIRVGSTIGTSDSNVINITMPLVVVDALPPIIMIDTSMNQTYTSPSLVVNWSSNEPIAWTGYSLDGSAVVTINGNLTLDNLSNGSHNLTIYANDSSMNMGNATVQFTILKTESWLSQYWAYLALGAIVLVVMCAVALVSIRKRPLS